MSKSTARAYSVWQDKEERERILLEQLPQVRYLARRIHERLPRHVPLDDLVHAGVIGLIDALNKFDPSKHVQFSSYAKFRIRGAILDSLREMDWGPRELRRKARNIEEAHRKLSLALNRAPSESEMAAELHLELKEFQLLLGELDGLEVGSLRVESPWDGKEEDLCDYLPNAPEDTPFFPLPAHRDEGTAGPRDCGASPQRTAGAFALLLRRTDHERSWGGAGDRRIAGFPGALAGRGAAAGAPRTAHERRRWDGPGRFVGQKRLRLGTPPAAPSKAWGPLESRRVPLPLKS
jgi:RNA polymerase sigma factor (sigma-70 family)